MFSETTTDGGFTKREVTSLVKGDTGNLVIIG